MNKYTVRIPVMCYANVTIECESEERDDIIEKAISSFEFYDSVRSDKIRTDVKGLNGVEAELICDGIWDDPDLINIETHEANKTTD